MTTAPTLSDGTVTLRAHRPDDVAGSFEQCQDPLSQRWTMVPVPYSMDDARTFVEEICPGGWADGSQWSFAIEHEGRYGGTVSLRPQGSGRAEIAYGSHPDVRGTGVVDRALRLLLEWGFTARDLRCVIWYANVGNWASRKVAWRLGFSCDGVLRAWQPQRGELRDAWVGTLLRADPREPRGRWLDPPVLDGETLRLRPFRDDDVARVVEACADPRTGHWLGQLPSPYTRADAHAWFEANTEGQATGRQVTWAVTEPRDDVTLGAINAFDLTERDCEIGYWTHPDARGRGVTTQAMRIVTDWVFTELDVLRVQACAAVDNTASRHVLESCGLRETGVARLGTLLRSGRADALLYDVLASEWAER